MVVLTQLGFSGSRCRGGDSEKGCDSNDGLLCEHGGDWIE